MLSTIIDSDKPYEQQWQDTITQTTSATYCTNLDDYKGDAKTDKIKYNLRSIEKEEKELSTRKSVLSGQLNATTRTLLKLFEVMHPELTSLIQIIQDGKSIDSQYKTLSERKTELQRDLISALEEDTKAIKTEQI